MNKIRFTLNLLGAVVFTLAITTMAQAQTTRTWVSGVGDDVNPCSRTAPCKTFAGAISKTATNGEISVLDPGGFGTLNITKAITVDGGGIMGSILNAGAVNGIIINLTNAETNKAVHLRNLSIQGVGTGLNGIRILQANDVTIENVAISGQTGHGIDIQNVITDSNTYLNNVTVFDVNGNGLNVSNSNVNFRTFVRMDNTRFNNCGSDGTEGGVVAGTSARITAVNVHVSGSSGAGWSAGGTGSAVLFMDNCTSSSNTGAGIAASNNGIVSVADNNIYQNDGVAYSSSGTGQIRSFGGNKVFNNASDVAPTGAPLVRN